MDKCDTWDFSHPPLLGMCQPQTPRLPDLGNLSVISVTEPRATHRFDCATCHKSIHRGDVHKKWVYKEFGEFKSIRYHLECNP